MRWSAACGLNERVAACAGNILDNHELISTLEQAKTSAVDIAEKLDRATVTAQEIEEVRVKYTSVAKRGAVLFFVMASLANITNMYENSLAAFLTVYNKTLATSTRDPSLEGRLRNIVEATTYDVYNYTCLGLFERHKLMFSFQVRRAGFVCLDRVRGLLVCGLVCCETLGPACCACRWRSRSCTRRATSCKSTSTFSSRATSPWKRASARGRTPGSPRTAGRTSRACAPSTRSVARPAVRWRAWRTLWKRMRRHGVHTTSSRRQRPRRCPWA